VVPLKDFHHDLDAMTRAITPRTRVVWLVNPGNPIGTFLPYAQIKQFLEKVPKDVVVVLDEAYYEYLADEDRVDSTLWLKEYPNLIIVRTFSKAHGLAGLRIGYGIALPEIADLLNRVRQPFNVNILALTAATAALDDKKFLEHTRKVTDEGRQQLLAALQALGLKTLPSYPNFVNVQVANPGVHEGLLRQGIIVRPLTGYGLPDWLRVTIGLPAENERFLTGVAKTLQS